MKIEKIVKLKNGKYKLYLDSKDVITTYDEVILKNNLLFNKEIDNELYSKIINENNYYELLNSCIKRISKRLRSEKEIKNYLEQKTNDIHLIEYIINELKQKNYINDLLFTKAYLSDKLTLTNSGINKIKSELYNLGIEEEIINDVVENNNIKNDYKKLENMIKKKIKLNNKYSNNYLKQKILNDMINLGYDREEIINIIDQNIKDDKDIYEKEYKKLYEKLKKKYQGKELEYQINQRLYRKGFTK